MGFFTIISQEEIDNALQEVAFDLYIETMTHFESFMYLMGMEFNISGNTYVELVYESGHITKPYKVNLLRTEDVLK